MRSWGTCTPERVGGSSRREVARRRGKRRSATTKAAAGNVDVPSQHVIGPAHHIPSRSVLVSEEASGILPRTGQLIIEGRPRPPSRVQRLPRRRGLLDILRKLRCRGGGLAGRVRLPRVHAWASPLSVCARCEMRHTFKKWELYMYCGCLCQTGTPGILLYPLDEAAPTGTRGRDTTEKINSSREAQTSASRTLLEQGRRSGRRPDPALLFF